MKTQKNIAIIPARGGSKRLPRKNVLSLNGKPLIEYSMDYALANKDIIDFVLVSTDDEEIKEIAKRKGISVIDRPNELSGDTVSTVAVLNHVIEIVEETFDNIILLQPTNPLRPSKLLSEAYKVFLEGGYDSLMTVTRNHQKFGKIIANKFQPFNYKMGQRSQDLDPLYFENGLLYISKIELIIQNKILGKNNYPFIVNHPFAHLDIDIQQDLDWASFLINNKLEK